MLLTLQPLWLSAGLVIVLPTLIAMLGPIVIRRRVAFDRLTTNNEVAGFKFATVGVLYAVLLAFAVIVVWEKFSDAEARVAQEASAATAIYRLAPGLGAEPGAALGEGTTRYLKAVIGSDWPAMEQGKASPVVTGVLNDIYARLLLYGPQDSRGAAVLTEILHQLDVVTEA